MTNLSTTTREYRVSGECHLEEKGYMDDQENYYRLVQKYQENPNHWFRVQGSLVEHWSTEVKVGGVRFQNPFTWVAMREFYLFPKGAGVAARMYPVNHPEIEVPLGYLAEDWQWKVQFRMKDGVLVIYRMRAITKSLDQIFDRQEYGQKRVVSSAIATESPRGTYILKITDFRYHYPKYMTGKKNLMVCYEVLNGQARGYQGVLFFDVASREAMKRAAELERALGVPLGTFIQSLQENKGIKTLTNRFLKAHLDFSGKYVDFQNPRAVSTEEVDLWL